MNICAQSSVGVAFRDAMAAVCTPVSVVTAMDNGRPHGTTVSAIASLSLDPPMMLVSLDCASDLLKLVRANGVFGVNVLASGQSALARRFAGKGETKFDGVDWQLSAHVPRLAGVSIWLACEVTELVAGGDHVVVLGAITEVENAGSVPPLTYHARGFGTHVSLPGQ